MKETLTRLLGDLLLIAALAGLAFFAGMQRERAAWNGREAQEVRQAQQQYQQEVQRGQEAADRYLTDLRDQEDRYDALDQQHRALLRRVPLLVPPAAAGAAPGAGSEPGVHPSDAAAPPLCIAVLGPVQPELSLGAVRLWNSALAGADVPAGACGADAQAGEACAAGAGLTAEDAWDNHAANARSCAADRLRLERLIDYLEGRKQ